MGIIEAIKKIEREEGLEKGRQEGREKGRQEGREEGLQEGREEGVTNLLKAKKFTISEIANFMNVSEAFVKKIKRKLKK